MTHYRKKKEDHDLREFGVDIKTFCTLGTQPRLLIASMMERHFTTIFQIDLEHTHFPPAVAALSNEFYACSFPWEDQQWSLISIPENCRYQAEEMAKRYSLHLADGVPTVVVTNNVGRLNVIGIGSVRNMAPPPVATAFPSPLRICTRSSTTRMQQITALSRKQIRGT